MPLGILLNVALLWVLPLFRYLGCWIGFDILDIPILHRRFKEIQDRGKGNYLLRFLILNLVCLSMGLCLASKFSMWISSIHFLIFCLPYFVSLLFIFLFPTAISYPWILTIHHLYISFSIGITWIDCCIFWTGKMQLGTQENLIRIPVLLGLLFWYLSRHSHSTSPQISVH